MWCTGSAVISAPYLSPANKSRGVEDSAVESSNKEGFSVPPAVNGTCDLLLECSAVWSGKNVPTFQTNLLRPSWLTNQQLPPQCRNISTRPPTWRHVQQDTNLQNDRNENPEYYVIIGTQSHGLTTVNTNSRRGHKIIPINIHSHNQLTYGCEWIFTDTVIAIPMGMFHIKKKTRNDWLAQINLPTRNFAEWLKSGFIINNLFCYLPVCMTSHFTIPHI